MRRCVIWGAEKEYDSILNQIRFEELKGNLKCIAVMSKSLSQFAKKKDGYPIIKKEELQSLEFDYLIIAGGEKYNQEIKKEALLLGIPNAKIIFSQVLKIPNFDFARYGSLRENPVTILSDDCWGGYMYHALDLPFTSPLVNIYWPCDSYCEFIKDPLFYLEQPLCMERDGNARQNLFPIGRLGEGEKSVRLHFIHEVNFHEAEEHWNRRKKRVNKDRIFVKFGFNAAEPRREEYLAAFDQVPYHKICVYSGETSVKNVLYSGRFEWDWFHGPRVEWINYNDWFRQVEKSFKVMDILKMLNGEPDYTRER